MMARFTAALFLAIAGHFFLFLLPFRQMMPPQLSGHQSITVQLAPNTVAVETTAEKNPPSQTAPLKKTSVARTEKDDNGQETSPPVVSPPRTEDRPGKILSATVLDNKIEPVEPGRVDSAPAPATRPVLVEARPSYQQNRKPVYPPLARRRGWEGTVTLSVLVKHDGSTGTVYIHSSSGYDVLDKAAVRAVTAWRFVPGTKGGLPIAMEVMVPVHFTLSQQ